jgi:Phage tail assembly chaperone proteins, E, or 41 or 14
MNKPEREGFVGAEEIDDVDEPKRSTITIDEAAEEAPAESAGGEDLPEWPMTIPLLHKPVETKPGVTITELTFREPTAGDIMRAGGNPCKVEIVEMGGGRVTWQPQIDDIKMLRLMASLSGVLEPYLQRMDTRDYASCAHRLRKYFLPEQGIW